MTAFAQESGGATINGTVTDPSGALISGAKITATQPATGAQRTTQTSSAGLYSLSALAAGTYDVTVEAPGFKQAKFAAVPVSVGAVVTLDAHLQVGAAQEVIDVSADAPVVETTRTQTSTVVNQKAISDLPINGRNFLDFAVLTPGVVRDPSRGGDLSFGGQRGTANSLTVDGSDANNVFFGQSTGRSGTGRSPYSFSQDAVQEFQVSANGYAAEIGRAGGGVINVITKSGTNDLHGTAFEFFRDKALNANSWENNRARLPKRNYHFNQFGGNLGGPIVKNKAFFFFDYDGQRNNEPITVIPGAAAPSDALSQQAFQSLQKYFAAYPRSLNNDVYLGKADLFLTAAQRLSVRYNANRFTGVNYENSGATSAAGHTGNSSVTTDNVSGTHTFVISGAAVLESRFTYSRDNEPGEANSTDPEAVIRQGGATVISIGRNNFSPRYTNARTVQWADSLSHVHGRHTFKAGLDINFQHIDNFFPGNFSGSYTFNSYADFASNRPFSFTQAFAGAQYRRAALHAERQRIRLLRAGFLARLRAAHAELRHSLRSLSTGQPESQESRSGPGRRQSGHQPDSERQEQHRRTLRLRLPAFAERQHRAARRRRQLLRPHSQHPDRHRVHAERNSGADLHADRQPAGVSEHPFRAAGIESHARYLRLRQGLRAAADLAMEPEPRAPVGTRLLPDRRLSRRARRAPQPHPRHQLPAGGTTAGHLRRRHAQSLTCATPAARILRSAASACSIAAPTPSTTADSSNSPSASRRTSRCRLPTPSRRLSIHARTSPPW